MGGFLRAPVSVTLDLEQYSAEVTITGWEPWMAGCSIRIGGETADNAIRAEEELVQPYLGPTASGVAATVYHDCISLAPGETEIFGPVEIPQTRRLSAAGSLAEFECYDVAQVGGNEYGHLWVKLHSSARQPAQPWAYFVDAEEGATGPVTRLRVLPIPDQLYPLRYSVRLAPPAIEEADILPDEDPGVEFPLPEGWDESVLLPLAIRRFTTHAAFAAAGPAVVTEINRQAMVAMGILRKWSPSRAAARLIGGFR